MSPLKAGAGIAAAVAGLPLYTLVRTGSLDDGTALLRWGLVAAACAAGVHYIERLIRSYEDQARSSRARRERHDRERAAEPGRGDGNPDARNPPAAGPGGSAS